jgi:hypothetical protein
MSITGVMMPTGRNDRQLSSHFGNQAGRRHGLLQRWRDGFQDSLLLSQLSLSRRQFNKGKDIQPA